MAKGRQMTDRVPVMKDTREELRDFAKGLGVTYDTAIRFLLRTIREENEAAFMAGHRLRFEVPDDLKEVDEPIQ